NSHHCRVDVFVFSTVYYEGSISESSIQVVYFVTNSEEAFREMTAEVKVNNSYQLYRDYIDNFVLGSRRDS
ncbi:hypothetical protein ABNB59_16720, partial [Paenibacillus larvae]